MFRNLIPGAGRRLSRDCAGLSGLRITAAPDRSEFKYSFDRFGELVDGLLDQLEVKSYLMYVMDYGAPVGWRLALKHPERITALIVQNGNAYEEGLSEGWNPIQAYWREPTQANREAARLPHAGDDAVPIHSRRRRPLAGFTRRQLAG